MKLEPSLLGRYIDEGLFSKRAIPFQEETTATVRFLDNLQREINLCGSIAEIGVAQGNFFVPLALCCRSSETAVAIDIFDDIENNWNPAGGSASLAWFQKMVSAKLRTDVNVVYIKGDSLFIDAAQISAANHGQKFRLFSIDGAHSATHTVNDLRLAGDVIIPGGIVFLDDIQNWGWPGVIDGFARYMLLNDYHRLVPFFLYKNKLLLTTPSHHAFYLEKAIEVPKSAGLSRPNVDYRISDFFGYRVLGY